MQKGQLWATRPDGQPNHVSLYGNYRLQFNSLDVDYPELIMTLPAPEMYFQNDQVSQRQRNVVASLHSATDLPSQMRLYTAALLCPGHH